MFSEWNKVYTFTGIFRKLFENSKATILINFPVWVPKPSIKFREIETKSSPSFSSMAKRRYAYCRAATTHWRLCRNSRKSHPQNFPTASPHDWCDLQCQDRNSLWCGARCCCRLVHRRWWSTWSFPAVESEHGYLWMR